MNPSYRLVMRSGPTVGKEFLLQKNEQTIGRDLNNDIVINDPEVSRRHARLYLQGANFVVEDLGSTNGTAVNGQRLMAPYFLRPGETIGFGEHITLTFEQVQTDADATVAVVGRAAAPVQRPVPPPPPPPPHPVQAAPPPAYVQPRQPVYAPPPAPVAQPESEYEEEPKKKFPIWLVIVLVAVLMLICICGIALWYIDANFLWCNFLPFLPGC